MGIFSKLALVAVAAVGVEALELKKVRAAKTKTMAEAKSEAEKEGAKGCKLSIDGKDATDGIPDDATAKAYDKRTGKKEFELVCTWKAMIQGGPLGPFMGEKTVTYSGKSSGSGAEKSSSGGGGMSNNGGGDDNKGSCECK